MLDVQAPSVTFKALIPLTKIKMRLRDVIHDCGSYNGVSERTCKLVYFQGTFTIQGTIKCENATNVTIDELAKYRVGHKFLHF